MDQFFLVPSKKWFVQCTVLYITIHFTSNVLQDTSAMYSVMQSDGNSFCGHVVLNSFNKACRVEDNILDQIYKRQICLDFYYADVTFLNISGKCILTFKISTKSQFSFRGLYTLDIHFLQSILEFRIFKIKIRKYLLAYIWSKMLSSYLDVVKALQDDISTETVPIRLHHTL